MVIKCLLYNQLLQINKKSYQTPYQYSNAVFISPQTWWLKTLSQVWDWGECRRVGQAWLQTAGWVQVCFTTLNMEPSLKGQLLLWVCSSLSNSRRQGGEGKDTLSLEASSQNWDSITSLHIPMAKENHMTKPNINGMGKYTVLSIMSGTGRPHGKEYG